MGLFFRREQTRRGEKSNGFGLVKKVNYFETISGSDSHGDLWQTRINEYLDKQLTLLQLNEFEQHLNTCKNCQKNLDELRLTVKSLQQLAKVTPIAQKAFKITDNQANLLHPRPQYRVSLWVSSVAAAVLAIFLILDFAGIFTATTIREEAINVQNSLPTFGTVESVKCVTPGEAGSVCASSSQNGEITIYPAVPPTRLITTESKGIWVILLEAGLMFLTIGSAIIAIRQKPRSLSKVRNL